MRSLASRCGRWSAAHPWPAIAGWLALVAIALVVGSATGIVKLTAAQSGSGEAGQAAQVLEQNVLVRSASAHAGDPSFQATIRDLEHRLTATGLVTELRSPSDPGNGGLVSADARAALVQFEMLGPSGQAPTRVGKVLSAVSAAAAAHPGFVIAESGSASISRAYDATVGRDFKRAEQLSIPITLVVLAFVFGALVAALLPLVLALSAIGIAWGLLA